MFGTAVVAGYWITTCSVVAGVCCREFLFLKPHRPWRVPANAMSHSGQCIPENTSIFASPGDIGSNSLSIAAHAPTQSGSSGFVRAAIGAAYGVLWGSFGLLVSAVETGFACWGLIIVSSVVMAITNRTCVGDAYLTYVNLEGFGIVTIRCDQSLTYFIPHLTREKRFTFNEIDSATLVGNDIVLRVRRWRLSIVSSTLLRPGCVSQDDWKKWYECIRRSLHDRDYSESLLNLLKSYRARYRMGLPNTLTSELGVTFLVHSVLGLQEKDAAAPIGRLAYCETGLILENWLPLYDSLQRNGLICEGLDFVLWNIKAIDRDQDVQRLVDDWRAEHVVALPQESFLSISADNDRLSFTAKDGRSFSFVSDQISDYELLLRLIGSSIWSAGIDVELISQMASDLKELCERDNETDLAGTVFGTLLPNHRAFIWHAAYGLELDRYPNVSSDRELRIRKRVFDDCRRATSHQVLTKGGDLMKSFDSARATDDLAPLSG